MTGDAQLVAFLHQNTVPWNNKTGLDTLLQRINTATVVQLGEASHGTHEYYTWRAEISKRLVTEKGFSFIAVEGDWPDCYELNRYVKHYNSPHHSAKAVLQTLERWPTWMWANEEVADFIEWLRQYNQDKLVEQRVGFYGLDVYSLWASMHAVVDYLQTVDPAAARNVSQAYRCFDPYGGDSTAYAYDTAFTPGKCEDEVVAALELLVRKTPDYPDDHEASFNAEQNARVARNAEQYYRTMTRGSAASWNVRDRHMHETLDLLLQRRDDTKAIVWAHNTHIGDARATDMAAEGMVNIGQLARESYGPANVVLVGFGSYEGSVIAGKYWDAPMQSMPVPAAKSGSFESLLHNSGGDNLLVMNQADLPQSFWQPLDHRAIGVVYDPKYEKFGNYVPSVIPERYDAFIYLDKTTALDPLALTAQHDGEPDETYPFGV